jgi:type II secretory pathway pseudopilin PulG
MKMRRSESGFTLIELVVVMGTFMVILLISAAAFESIIKGASRETKLAESQVADIIGLELLRIDLEQAGYGLPTSYQQAVVYSEAASQSNFPVADTNPNDMNIPAAPSPGGTTDPPRPLAGGVNNFYFNNKATSAPYNGSDYLVIRSTAVARNDAAQKWSYVVTGDAPIVSDVVEENFVEGEKCVVVRPVFRPTFRNELVMPSGAGFYAVVPTDLNPSATATGNDLRTFYPVDPNEKRIIYGLVDDGVTPRMPFNRADYYIRRPAADLLPQRCAPNTGILYKGILNNTTATGGGGITEIPLMDCVADFQVVFGLDSSDDGAVDNYADVTFVAALDGVTQRRQVKEVWAFVLTHEGGPDRNYNYPNSTLLVGENIMMADRGNTFNFATVYGSDNSWRNYRWRVHKLAVKPKNLF